MHYFVLIKSDLLPTSFQYQCVRTLQSMQDGGFPVLLRTTKLAHNALPSTASYFNMLAPTLFPVLLRTAKLAQSTSQYYFVLQSSHKHFPVLLCTTKNARSTSLYHFLLQSCGRLSYSQRYFVLQQLAHEKLLHRIRSVTSLQTHMYASTLVDRDNLRQFIHTDNFCRQTLLHAVSFLHTHLDGLHCESLSQRPLSTQRRFSLHEQNFFTQQLFTHSYHLEAASFYTKKLGLAATRRL